MWICRAGSVWAPREHQGRVINLSLGGAMLSGVAAKEGDTATLLLGGYHPQALKFSVRGAEGEHLHVKFELEEAALRAYEAAFPTLVGNPEALRKVA